MLLKLYDQYGSEKVTLSPNDTSTQDKEIQGDNVLSLSFTLYEYVGIDVNDYVDFEGERYWALEKYHPNEKSTVEWEYNVKLYGIESLIKRFLVLKTVDGANEAVFTLTARPIEHMRLIVQNINDGMDHTTNFKVGTVVGTDNVVIDYTGKYCDEGLKELAEAVGVEWWIEGTTVNLCRCEHGDELTLSYGSGLTSLDRDVADNAKFYTRLFPIGSSRNIDTERYGASRLQLPGGVKYVDVNADRYGIIHHYEQEAFSNIYPHRIGVVSSVRSENVNDRDGNPFTIYYFKDNDLPFDPNEYEIGGLVKRVSFQEGSELAGLGADNDHYFEVNYNGETGEFEIITIWPYDDDTQLPGGTLVPKAGDKYILWNISMPDVYYGLAEREFQSAVDDYNARHTLDVTRYKAPTDHVWIEDEGVELYVGRKIRLESQEYFPETGYRSSRITRISRQVTLPSQMDLEISDALSVGMMTKIEDSIHDVKAYAKELIGDLPDIIKTGDSTPWTDHNLLSALRTKREFLSKTKADTAQGIITFLRGICFGASQSWKITGDGDAILHDINAQNAIFNTLTAQNAHFFNLIIDEIKSVGGQLIITPANCRIDEVVEIEGGWKCYFKKSDGTRAINNQWVPGMQAIHQEFNVNENGTRNYWRVVTAIGEEKNVKIDEENIFDCHYIVLGNKQGEFKSDPSLGNKFIAEPQAGDDLSQLGFNEAWCLAQPNGTLPSDYKQLENAIILSAYNIPFIDKAEYLNDVNGIKAPLYVSYRNINSFNVGQENRVVAIAGNGNLFRGQVVIEQGSTLADGRDVNNLGVQEGNLLRNSGFTGDYESIEVDGNMDMSADTEVYSDPLKYWTATNAEDRVDASAVEVIEESNAVSGFAAVINGNLSQEIDVYPDTWYMLMLKAYISDNTDLTLSINLGGESKQVTVTNSMQRFALPILTGNTVDNTDKKLVLSGENITVYDLMLVQGNIPTGYKPSEKDNDKTLAELLNLEYLKKAIYEANTEILGGLILSAMVWVGKYVNGKQQNTGGMSGLYTDENSPFLWGGGTFEQAIETIMYYASRRPEHYYDEEPEGHVNFAVTHGGTAILNDIILRGYINAIGGIFKNVRSANGKWSLDEDGFMRCVNAWISGSIYTPYFIINNENIEEYSTVRQITIRWGITERLQEVRVLDIEKTGFSVQIDYQINEGMPLFIMLPDDDKFIGAEVNVFQNSIHRCALVHISKLNMDDNRYYEYFNPLLLKGQKIKLKCFKDGNINRWFPESYSDALRFRTPLEIAYVEVEVLKINDEWILRESVGRYHSEARFQYVRNNVGKYIVTLPSDWRSVGVMECDVVPHSYVMLEYNRGAYASVIDKDPITRSFTIQVADDDSVNDGNFGFTVFLNRDEESIDIDQILSNN